MSGIDPETLKNFFKEAFNDPGIEKKIVLLLLKKILENFNAPAPIQLMVLIAQVLPEVYKIYQSSQNKTLSA